MDTLGLQIGTTESLRAAVCGTLTQESYFSSRACVPHVVKLFSCHVWTCHNLGCLCLLVCAQELYK